jgi:hypothetical protein
MGKNSASTVPKTEKANGASSRLQEVSANPKAASAPSTLTIKKKRILISDVRSTRSPIADSVLPPAQKWMFR